MRIMMGNNREPASFRDPSGFLFWKDGKLYRQVNQRYQTNYELLIGSGLYGDLVDAKLLIPHQEVDIEPAVPDRAYRTILPEIIPFISYPYEWSFSQLQDAALTTLTIQERALDAGMSLKDASAYNIQFYQGKPLLIDTLSFEEYQTGKPWVAYRQFCQHFLAPLALMSFTDIRLSQLLRIYIDGIPLDLASELLPWRTRFNFPLLTHIHFHASAQKRFAGEPIDPAAPRQKMSKLGLMGIISSLKTAIMNLKWDPEGTSWVDYDRIHTYGADSWDHKKQLISSHLDQIQPSTVWDLGANTGEFSRIASQRRIPTLAFDIDPGAVERNYRQCREEGDQYLLPLLLDITNPSPSLGWFSRERQSFLDRGPTDLILALALIHHLAITNNVPLELIAQFFSELGTWLVIEFVPKEDSQTQKLLSSREDIFHDYNQQKFEESFSTRFNILDSTTINGTDRVLYLMRRKD